MKILYAIQGTGNGHLSRATALLPLLKQRAKVDVLISGNQSQLAVSFSVEYYRNGLSFIPSSKGGIDLKKTLKQIRLFRFFKEVRSLPVEQYDLVISDFEPVSAWACKLKGVKCFEFSHQAAVRMKESPQSKRLFPLGRIILEHYCPSQKRFGFHFSNYNDHTFFPILRPEIVSANPSNGNHVLVYLTAYSFSLLEQCFSKMSTEFRIYTKEVREIIIRGNITAIPIGEVRFFDDLVSCKGVICGAGFELPAEALYLQKKLLVLPYENHYEQHCNAQALRQLGVTVLYSLNKENQEQLQKWINDGQAVDYSWTNQINQSIETVLGAAQDLTGIVPVWD